jgi:multiple sugar transport system substrate-binding protein
MRTTSRRRLITSSSLLMLGGGARAAEPLVVTAFPNVDRMIRAALPQWQLRNPGAEVRVVSRAYPDHHTAMTTALSTSGHLPDLMALETSYLGGFALGGGLLDLSEPPFEAGRLANEFAPFAFALAHNRAGRVVALPADIGPGTLLYREDLLRRAGIPAESLTRSWAHYVEAGERLKRATGAYLISHARTLKDLMVRCGVPAGSGQYFDAQQRPSVTAERFQRAFELARRVRRAGLDARVANWTPEWAEGLKRGLLATELSGAWMAGQMANWVCPNTKGLWRVTQLPQDCFAYYGGTYYAMPRRADPAKRALAWSLMQALTLDPLRQLQGFQSEDAFPALKSVHADAFFEQPLAFLGGQRARLLWREAAQHIQALPIHRQHRFADEVINAELDNVLEFDKPIADALADAQRVLEVRALR